MKDLKTLDFDPRHYPYIVVQLTQDMDSWLCPFCLNELNHFFNNCKKEECYENREKKST